MAPRTKHRPLSATGRTHSNTSLHKSTDAVRLAGLTTIKAANPRDSLAKAKKHSSSSSGLAAKRMASRTSVHRASTTRINPSDKQPTMTQSPKHIPAPEDEGWVSSGSGAGTPVNPENDDDDDDDDDELDDDEILVLQTQRANRNAREAERLKAAMLAADIELRAKREEVSLTPPARDSPTKHTSISPAHLPQPPVQPQPLVPKQQPAKPSPPVVPKAPVVQQAHVEDHTKHTFPTQHTPSPPTSAPEPARTTARQSDPPIVQDFALPKSNGAPTNGSNGAAHVEPGTNGSRPAVRRALSHAPRPTSMNMTPARTQTQLAPPRAAPSRPHPLIRAPSLLTKTTPSLPPLTAPPYLSAHSAQAQISSSPPLKTPTSGSTRSSPSHTRQPSLSSSTHTLPTLQVSPTATLSASVSSLPHASTPVSPQPRASSLYHSQHTTTSSLHHSTSPTLIHKPIPERERTVSAVSSTAALHALAHHHPLRPNHAHPRSSVQASTFPPEPADTYGGGMYGGGPGAGVYAGGASSSAVYSHSGAGSTFSGPTVGGSGGMYGGKPGPVHALLPAPYMATHLSVGRWYAPAREAVGRVIRGKNGV